MAEARRKLLDLTRNYFNFLQAVPGDDVALGEREEAYERFLFPGGKLGDLSNDPEPEAVGTVSFDAATRELVAPALPAHATFLRAYRQAPGGDPERAGVSETTRVPVTEFEPATPGVTYAAWLVGVNSRGKARRATG